MAQPRGSTERTAALIAAYPGPVILRVPSRKSLVLLATFVVFGAFGVQMLFDPPTLPGAIGIAWFIIVASSLGTLACALMLHPGASRLTLDGDGFEVSRLFRRRRSDWRTTGEFLVGHVGPAATMVVYDDSTQRGVLAERNRERYGHNSALPDTYGLDLAALAKLLNAWREHATAEH
jgi:hypothetical protein